MRSIITRDKTPKIAVVGVGGGGGNAINTMIRQGVAGVKFIAANTDAQALSSSLAEYQVQLGRVATQGLGAGSLPELGRIASLESIDDIMMYLEEVQVCFLAAGMGGGTGTGAAPVIANAARQAGILTIAVVTEPFGFEGTHRARQAKAGIQALIEMADTVIVIPNQNLFHLSDHKTTLNQAFRMVDMVLHEGIRSLVELVRAEGLINLDFADVQSVMKDMGRAIMATGSAEGIGRATAAAKAAVQNPLFSGLSLLAAKSLLVSISASPGLTLFEVEEVASYIRDQVDTRTDMILGANIDKSLEGELRVSIIAAGLDGYAEVISLADHLRRSGLFHGAAL